MAQYEWIPLYKEIAQKLLQFYGDRRPLVQLVNDIFAETGLNMPKLEQNSQLVDIDPFTVFGLFNKSSMREDKRRKILANDYRAKREEYRRLQTVKGNIDQILRRSEPQRRKEQSHER